jgi:hypothetical protein
MSASLIGKMIWKGTKWVAKKAVKRRKVKALKKAQSPSKLPKDVTKHSKAQKVRAQIADPKNRKFPSAKKIKESGIKLKYLDPKRSRKGMSQVRYKPKDKLNKGVRTAYSVKRKGIQEYEASYDAHPRHYWKKMAGFTVGAAAAMKGIFEKDKKRIKIKKNKRRAKPYSQKTPVRGIQLGAPGTQSGTSRSKRKYK